MKKLTIDSQAINIANNCLNVSIPQNMSNLKIVDAFLNIKVASMICPENGLNVYLTGSDSSTSDIIIDNIRITDITEELANQMLTINISDELQDYINKKEKILRLKFDEGIVFLDDNTRNIDVEYISLAEFQENGSYQEFDIGKGGKASINLATEKVDLKTIIVPSDNNVLPFSIYARYNDVKNDKLPDIGTPDGWQLNVNQFLIKDVDGEKLSFTYIDKDGKNQIIEEGYYYLDENNKKIRLSKSSLNVDLNGNLKYGRDETLRNFSFEDSSYRVFDSSNNIRNLVEKLEKLDNFNFLSLLLKTKNAQKTYKCTSIEIFTQERTKKINTGNQMVVKDCKYNVKIAIATFENGEDEISLLIDSDPTDSNKIKTTSSGAIAFGTNKLGTTNSEIDINYFNFSFQHLPQDLEYIELKEEGMEVFTSLESPTGLKLVSSIKDIPGSELVDYEPEELIQVRDQLKQLEDSKLAYENNQSQLKKQIFINCLTKYCAGNSNLSKYLPENSSNSGGESALDKFNEFADTRIYKLEVDETWDIFTSYFGDNKTFSNEELRQLIANLNEIGQYKKELARMFKEYGSDYDLENNIVSPAIGDAELLSIQSTLDSCIFQYNENIKNLSQIEKSLKKLSHKLKQLEAQVPVHYLYDENNVIYGFGKTANEKIFRLILIMDAYENAISISYKSLESNKIEKIIDSAEKTILLNYDKTGLLESIVDSRDRVIKFICNENNHLTKIIHSDQTSSNYCYNDSENYFAVVDQSGKGVVIYQDGDSKIIQPISVITSVEHGKVVYKGKESFEQFDFKTIDDFVEYFIEDEKIEIYKNNYTSTTLTDSKGKSMTYLFDKLGKVRTIYENKFDENLGENCVRATKINYQDSKISQKISNLPYSQNYLEDVCFDNDSIKDVPALFLGTTTCGGHSIPFSYQVCGKLHTLPDTKNNSMASIQISAEMLKELNNNDSLCKHRTFVVSGWAKADSAFTITDEEKDFADYIKNRKFELRTEISYQGDVDPTIVQQSFDWRNTGWQYCSLAIDIDTTKTITKIECIIDYSNNVGNIEHSDLEFKEADWEVVEYNADNLPVRKEFAHDDWATIYEYDNSNKLIKEIRFIKNDDKEIEKVSIEQGFITTYEYNKQGKLLRTIDYNDIVKENVYNDKGCLIKSITYNKYEPSSKFYEEQNIDEKGNITSDVNELGKEVTKFEYIKGTGVISAKTDENDIKTVFGYDKSDRLLETSVAIDGVENTNTFGYTNELLTSLKHNGFEIKYNYDDHGRISQINIDNGRNESIYFKREYSALKEITTLPNGEKYLQTFNADGNVLDTYFFPANVNFSNENIGIDSSLDLYLISRNIYDTYGNLVFIKDLTNSEKLQKIFIDKFGNNYEMHSEQHDKNIIISNTYDDSHKNIETTTINFGDNELCCHYEYQLDKETPDSKLVGIELSDEKHENRPIFNQLLDYDKLGRISSITTNNLSKHFSYLKSGDHTSNLISMLQFGIDKIGKESLRYIYDNKGNITEIRENNNLLARYKYDGLSRIIREDNNVFKKTVTFTYDAGGNITERREYSFTLSETFDSLACITFPYFYPISGWKDQLKEYNGEKFEYDAIGNPTTYRDKNLIWSHGRQLNKFSDIAEFKYNCNGLRTSKTANGFTTQFFLNGNKIIKQHDSCNDLTFYYGADGLTGFHLKNNVVDADYFYKKNAQNDIIGIYSTDGTQITRYSYDAWGNQKAQYLDNTGKFLDIPSDFMYNDTSDINAFITFKNPFRYRSYYYDYETNLYYLNSRYYDPEIGRFINVDDISNLSPTELNGLNLYAYCVNNPVMLTDNTGTSWLTDIWNSIKNFFVNNWEVIVGTVASAALIIGGVALTVFTGGAAAAFGATMISAGVGSFLGGLQSKLNGGSYWAGYLGGFISGGLTGLGFALGPVGAITLGFAGNFIGSLTTDFMNGDFIDDKSYWLNLTGESAVSALISLFGYKFGNASKVLKDLNLQNIFAGVTVGAEFVFSLLTDKFKELYNYIRNFISNNFFSFS